MNGAENNIFQTEVKDAKIESSELPPLYPNKNNNTSDSKNANNTTNTDSNVNTDQTSSEGIDTKNNNINKNKKQNDINNNEENNSNNDDDNNNSEKGGTSDPNNTNNENEDETNHENTDEKNDDNQDQSKDKSITDTENKEEIKIGDDENDGILQEQASALIGTITGESTQKDDNDSTKVAKSTEGKEAKSKSNSQKQSSSTSQKNSTKSSTKSSTKNSTKSSTPNSTINSIRNSAPLSNRSSSSQTSRSYHSLRNSSKTGLSQRRVGKLPSTKISYNQEMSKIPKEILHNPYVTKRLNIFPPRKTAPPKAALSHVEYRNRTPPQTDELTEKILNGEKLEEEPTVEQLKNSANILRNIEKDFIDKSQYPEAKKASDALQKTLRLINKKNSSTEVKTDLEDLIAKRNELIILADSRKNDWNDAISKYQSNTEAHVQDMKKQHQEVIEKFNSEIPSELTPLFKRNSVCYLTMRSNEKYLAINRHFDEAQKMKLKADQIEEIEREANFSKMDEYYRKKREKLRQLQELEIVNYLSYADTRKNELIFQREKSVTPPLQRAERINREIKRICEKRGIKQSQLNFDLVDDERVKLIKSKEKENEEIFQHSENSKTSTKSKKKRNSEENEKNKNEEEENNVNNEEEQKNENEQEQKNENEQEQKNENEEEQKNENEEEQKNENEEEQKNENEEEQKNENEEEQKNENEGVQKNESKGVQKDENEEEINEKENIEKAEEMNDKTIEEEEEDNS